MLVTDTKVRWVRVRQVLLLAPLLCLAMVGTPHASGQTYGDITFFVGSDLHYGYTDGTNASSDVCRATLDSMNVLSGQAYPDGAGGGTAECCSSAT